MITKRSKLLSLVLSIGLLMGLAVTGCTDKDREPGPIPTPTPVPETTTDVYVNVSALDLAYDALYCTINTPEEDVDGEEATDESFQVEVNEEGLGLIAEDQEVGSTISFSLSFQLEGEEVATYEAQDVIVSADEEGNCIIVVDEVTPVTPEEGIDVYVDASNVKVGYTKAIAKVGEEETDLEFDEDGISTTPVTTVKEGEKAKFSLSFVQEQSDVSYQFSSENRDVNPSNFDDPVFSEVEIATYDAGEEGIEVSGEEGQATVAIDEVAIVSPNCISVDLSQVTLSKEYKGQQPVYAVLAVQERNDQSQVNVKAVLVKLHEGLAAISLDGIVDEYPYYIAVGFFPETNDFRVPIATAEIASYDDPIAIDQEAMYFSISDDDIHEFEE